MSNELIEIQKESVLTVFSSEDGLRSVIEQAKQTVNEFEHDLSTQAGRNRTKSLARKVATLKTRLDDMGKELTADWKAKAKAVDANRKIMRDELDELKVLARKPVTEWEEEQARIEAEEKAKEEAEALRKQIETDHEIAILMNNEHDRLIAEKLAAEAEAERLRLEAEEKARIEREKQIAEQARIQAELEAKQREEALVREAKEKEEEAERERLAAIEREKEYKRQQELAEKARLEAEEKAKRDAIEAAERAKQQEIERQEKEKARVKAEQEQREANRQHVAKIRSQAKESLMTLGLDEETAKRVVLSIHAGDIANVSIKY
jgi:colicin import membrane protein